MMTASRMRVHVSGWLNSRVVIVEDGRVMMEVARTANNCHHCATCRRRVDDVEKRLANSKIVWKWEFPCQGGMWLALTLIDGKDAIDLLRETTGLCISC